ncbi:hypothetical protein [Aliiroseovarius marinus]|uniref:hypothetical protein n=1 Tax=Aliiroseovarius marinus TaxID=2500159 RepID=UPI003D7CD7FD
MLTHDLYLVIGLAVLVLSLPAIAGALSEGRAPRAASIMVLIGGGLIVLAVMQKPGGYTLEEIPGVIYSVIGYFLR